MSSQGTLNRAKSGPELLNHDHPGKVAGANIEAAAWKAVARNTQSRKYAGILNLGRKKIGRYRNHAAGY